MWRPEDWDNPWSKKHIVEMDEATLVCMMDFNLSVDNLSRRDREAAYEGGADAILIALGDDAYDSLTITLTSL